jgi:hypothetical protein
MDIESIVDYVQVHHAHEIAPVDSVALKDFGSSIGMRVPRALAVWLSSVGSVKIDGKPTLTVDPHYGCPIEPDEVYRSLINKCNPDHHIDSQILERINTYRDNLIPFLRRDDKSFYCLFVARGKIKDGDCPIVVWETSNRDFVEQYMSMKIYHPSFVNWLAGLLGVPEDAAGVVRKRRKPKTEPLVHEVMLGERSPIEKVLAEIVKLPSTGLLPPATDAEIDAAEGKTRLKFPRAFRQFLQATAGMQYNGEIVLGVGSRADADEERSLVRVTLREREEGIVPLRPDLIPIQDEGNGDWLCLLPKEDGSADCPVVRWVHDGDKKEDQRPERVAPSFRRWLIDKILEGPSM